MLVSQKSIVYILIIFILFSLSNYYVEESVSLRIDGNMTDGIDVSAWQGNIDWPLVYNDSIHFCFAKATEGVGWYDSLFETNIIGGKNAGLYMGAYHFATPTSNDAIDEAEYFVNIAEPYISKGYLRPVLDLEQGSYLGEDVLSTWIHDWMQTVENLTGVQPILYVNSNYANNFLNISLTCYDLWIAHWTYNPNMNPDTGIWDEWAFWQYSDQGMINGVSGSVDLNVFNGNLSSLTSYVIDDDANQSIYDRPFLVRHASDGDWGGAQNFVPSVGTLTRVELLMKKLGTPTFDLTVELREESIDGILIDTIVLNPGDFSSDWEWIEFDFDDVTVTSGSEYFIVLNPPPSGVTNTFGYGWGYALDDVYDDGSLWFTRTSGSFWLDLPDLYEFTFRTYGYE